jgi:hypothetical protein
VWGKDEMREQVKLVQGSWGHPIFLLSSGK